MRVHFADERLGWAVGDNGTILKTQDGGKNWKQPTRKTEMDIASVRFINPTIGWAVGVNGLILATTDGGITWNTQTGVNANLWDVFFVDASHGWVVGENGKIYMTKDGGKQWEVPDSIDLSLPEPISRIPVPPVAHPIAYPPPVLSNNSPEPLSSGGPMHDKAGGQARPTPVLPQARQSQPSTSKSPSFIAKSVPPASVSSSGSTPTRQVPTASAAPIQPAILGHEPIADNAPKVASDDELFHKLEKLYDLMNKGVISAEEYEAKKTEMLDFISAHEQLFSSLERLHMLMVKGIIAVEEFEVKKSELLKKLI